MKYKRIVITEFGTAAVLKVNEEQPLRPWRWNFRRIYNNPGLQL